MTVQFKPWPQLTEQEREAVRQLQITERQLEYAGPTSSAVAACEAGAGGDVLGVAAFSEQQVCGFLLLKKGAALPAWAPPGSVVVGSLRVDERLQGRGLGTAVAAGLPALIRQQWPGSLRLVLQVDEENLAGIRAYLKAGWVEQGERTEGRIGWVRQLAFP